MFDTLSTLTEMTWRLVRLAVVGSCHSATTKLLLSRVVRSSQLGLQMFNCVVSSCHRLFRFQQLNVDKNCFFTSEATDLGDMGKYAVSGCPSHSTNA